MPELGFNDSQVQQNRVSNFRLRFHFICFGESEEGKKELLSGETE